MAELPADVLHRLNQWLADQGVSQTDFARRVGCSRSFVSQLLAGKRRLSAELADAIERETGEAISFDELMRPAREAAERG